MSSSAATGGQDPADAHPEHRPVTGWVQVHGLVMVVREASLRIVQASASTGVWLQRRLDTLLLTTLDELGGDLAKQLAAALSPEGPSPGGGAADLTQAWPAVATAKAGTVHRLSCHLPVGGRVQAFTGLCYRLPGDAVVLELEPAPASAPEAGAMATTADGDAQTGAGLMRRLAALVQAISEARDVEQVRSRAAHAALTLTGLTAELLAGQDLPRYFQGAPRGGLQLQVDTHQEPVELVPQLLHDPAAVIAGGLDLSRGRLGSLPRAAVLALREQGVRALVRVPVQSDGKPWGCLVLQADGPIRLPERLRAALELLAEAAGMRLAAIDHHARARVAKQLHGLEQRLLDATSMEGDWRQALVRDASTLLQPLAATGAVLMHDGDIFSCGLVPPQPELRLLLRWAGQHSADPVAVFQQLTTDNPTLAALAPEAARVLSVQLSDCAQDRLLWLRAAQLADGSDSPVWSATDQAAASGVCRAVAEVSVQVHAVRQLIAENQLAQLRTAVAGSRQPLILASTTLANCQPNAAFDALVARDSRCSLTHDELLTLFDNTELAHRAIGQVRAEHRPWRGELNLRLPGAGTLPAAVRAEPVPARDGSLLGYILLFTDLRAARLADAARRRLEATLSQTRRELRDADHGGLLAALLANAGIAAMDIDDDELADATAPLLEEVEASAARTAALFRRLQSDD